MLGTQISPCTATAAVGWREGCAAPLSQGWLSWALGAGPGAASSEAHVLPLPFPKGVISLLPSR